LPRSWAIVQVVGWRPNRSETPASGTHPSLQRRRAAAGHVGAPGDVPVLDFDGDGKTDVRECVGAGGAAWSPRRPRLCWRTWPPLLDDKPTGPPRVGLF